VSLVSFGKLPEDHQLVWMRGLSGVEYYATNFPLEWMQDSSAGVAASMDYLERLISCVKPDVLHSNQYCYGAIRSSVPKLVVAHSDVLSWWEQVHGKAASPDPWLLWYQCIVTTGLGDADIVVAPSQWMLDALAKHYGSPSKATVIYNGRDPKLFSCSTPKTGCVLSAGRLWDEGKQIRLLLARRQAIPVEIAGSYQHPDRKNGVAPDWHGDADVKLLGPQSEESLIRLYARSAVYAVTSRYEPFGLAAVEAALSRCALVVNDIPIFHELWGKNAVYFRRNDPDALFDAIRTLGEDRELCEDFAQRAWQRACDWFDSQRMVSEYEALYNQAVCQGAAA